MAKHQRRKRAVGRASLDTTVMKMSPFGRICRGVWYTPDDVGVGSQSLIFITLGQRPKGDAGERMVSRL
ncbi:MAG: hypothetical protein LBM07_00665 [Culturomica sp.]|nr:hypothetical protein [Culturomica sp.]